jgi:hypothetical protein
MIPKSLARTTGILPKKAVDGQNIYKLLPQNLLPRKGLVDLIFISIITH